MDLTKILKVDDKVYSPLGGNGIVLSIDHKGNMPLKIQWENGSWSSFTREGKYYSLSPECLLFPSKENRDWSNWIPVRILFKPFDKVLMRNTYESEWSCGYFSHLSNAHHQTRFCVSGLCWGQCIPYNEETKHLIGKSDDCPKKYVIW